MLVLVSFVMPDVNAIIHITKTAKDNGVNAILVVPVVFNVDDP